MFSALGKAKQPYQWTEPFKDWISRCQPRAKPTSSPSIDNCLQPAMINDTLHNHSCWVRDGSKAWEKRNQKSSELDFPKLEVPHVFLQSLIRIQAHLKILPPLHNHPSFSTSVLSLNSLSWSPIAITCFILMIFYTLSCFIFPNYHNSCFILEYKPLHRKDMFWWWLCLALPSFPLRAEATELIVGWMGKRNEDNIE